MNNSKDLTFAVVIARYPDYLCEENGSLEESKKQKLIDFIKTEKGFVGFANIPAESNSGSITNRVLVLLDNINSASEMWLSLAASGFLLDPRVGVVPKKLDSSEAAPLPKQKLSTIYAVCVEGISKDENDDVEVAVERLNKLDDPNISDFRADGMDSTFLFFFEEDSAEKIKKELDDSGFQISDDLLEISIPSDFYGWFMEEIKNRSSEKKSENSLKITTRMFEIVVSEFKIPRKNLEIFKKLVDTFIKHGAHQRLVSEGTSFLFLSYEDAVVARDALRKIGCSVFEDINEIFMRSVISE